MQPNEFNVIHNTEHKRFQVQLNEHIAELTYHLNGNIIIFTHTRVPSALGGRGIGSLLVKTGLEYAKKNDLKVQTLCRFVDEYL